MAKDIAIGKPTVREIGAEPADEPAVGKLAMHKSRYECLLPMGRSAVSLDCLSGDFLRTCLLACDGCSGGNGSLSKQTHLNSQRHGTGRRRQWRRKTFAFVCPKFTGRRIRVFSFTLCSM